MTSHFEITFWEEFSDKKEEEGCFFSSFPSSMAATQIFLESADLLQAQTAGALRKGVYLYYLKPSSITNPDDCLVTRIRVYKQTGALQHESVVISFQLLAEAEHHLLVERNIDIASLYAYISRSSQSLKLASDITRLISTPEPPEMYGEVVWTLTMPNAENGPNPFRINLVQISTLLSVVSRTDEEYNLTGTNCYWFTWMIREALLQIILAS